jgi:cleavage and polyadenylation specificity factor subunit 5
VDKAKEVRKMYVVHMPERCVFAVPSNYSMQAIPIVDLYKNAVEFGTPIASIPHNLSRFSITCV